MKIMILKVTLSPLALVAFPCKTGTFTAPGIWTESAGGWSPFPKFTIGCVGVEVGVLVVVLVGVLVAVFVGVAVFVAVSVGVLVWV